MKKIICIMISAAVLASCCIGITVSADDTEGRILSLMRENPVNQTNDSMGVMSEEDAELNEIKRVSNLYSVSAEIVSLSAQMDINEYLLIESDVNQYIADVDAAADNINASSLKSSDEYKSLINNRTILNEEIDMQPPKIISVDSIYPNQEFWVRVHMMYKSSSDREFTLQFKNYTMGEEIAEAKGTIYAGSYSRDVRLRAENCAAGDSVTISVIYKGVNYSTTDGCSFEGTVLSAQATEKPTEKPTQKPTAEPKEDKSIEMTTKDDSEKELSSVGTSSWSNAEVTAAIALGIVPERLQGGYKEYITRAEFCALAASAIEMRTQMTITDYAAIYGSNEASFTDTEDSTITACAMLGIVNGFEDGCFRPEYVITREQAAAMLARCARKLGLSDKPGIFIFNDNDSISGWARGHVRYVRANEIMNGDDDNNFMPHSCYTVEQAIITFYRMYIKLE